MKDNKNSSIKITSLNRDKIKKIGGTFILAATIGISSLSLSECNKDILDTNKTFDKAIIVGNGIVTIYDIKQYAAYDTERYQLSPPDDTYLMTSTVTTRFVNTENSDIDIEEFAKTLAPADYEIRYVGENELNAMKKEKVR